jgi:hypothetical protein
MFNAKPYPVIKRDRFKIFACNQLAKWQSKLHATGSSMALLSWDIVDAYGNILRREEQKSNSFTRNYYNQLCTNAVIPAQTVGTTYAAGSLAKKNTAAAMFTTQIGACEFATSQGIYVGSSVTAESFEDYVIATLIANGSGAGQLVRGTQISNMLYDSGTKKWTSFASCLFFNQSGGAITINEVCYYKNLKTDASTTAASTTCVIRDSLSDVAASIVLANATGVNITYTLNYTFP